ncbi:MAG: hypothetical protein JW994_06145 [Candidatus Omnitrophica bacterium]|nr:hypothetical protein [Candidatus Omnitrophota bacterium]
MKNEQCLNCSEYKRCRDSFLSWFFFLIGMAATISVRAVTLLTHVNPAYGKIAWYVGIVGFFAFFAYKFNVARSRARIVANLDLLRKIRVKNGLSENDYEAIGAILCALRSDKERLNYFFIFALSAIAIVFAVYFDFFK